MGIPVFRPRPRHVFLAGRVEDLRLRCFNAVCLLREYVTHQGSRLFNTILRKGDAYASITRQMMYHANGEDKRGVAHVWRDHERVQSLTGADEDDWVERFCMSNPETFADRCYTMKALFETLPLGLPWSLMTAVLRNDYGLKDLTEPQVKELIGLAGKVVYDLGPFLEDRTVYLAGARTGLSMQQVINEHLNTEHLDTAGAALLGTLRHGERPARLLRSGSAAGPASGTPRRALAEYRGLSSGGRPAIRANQSAVRGNEVLMSADDVMVETAYAIVRGGLTLLGVAGEEFILEVPEGRDKESVQKLREAVNGVNRRPLQEVPIRVSHEKVDRW
jgi:hypothetical protein